MTDSSAKQSNTPNHRPAGPPRDRANEKHATSNAPFDARQQHADRPGGAEKQDEPRSPAEVWNVSSNTDLTEDQWNHLRSQVRQRWPQVQEEDLLLTQGDFNQLCAMLQHHTGESYEAITQEVDQMIDREPESEGSASPTTHTISRPGAASGAADSPSLC